MGNPSSTSLDASLIPSSLSRSIPRMFSVTSPSSEYKRSRIIQLKEWMSCEKPEAIPGRDLKSSSLSEVTTGTNREEVDWTRGGDGTDLIPIKYY